MINANIKNRPETTPHSLLFLNRIYKWIAGLCACESQSGTEKLAGTEACDPWISAFLAGITLSISWLLPNTITSSIFGWITSFLFCICLYNSAKNTNKFFKSLLPFYITGIISHACSFYWLIRTINYFGMLPFWLALIVFGFFVVISALQFLLVSYLFNKISEKNLSGIDNKNCSLLLKLFRPLQIIIRAFPATLIWTLSETLIFRLFPWQLGHTQAKFLSFIQIAEIGGVTLISFVMLFICELLYKSIVTKKIQPFAYAICIFLLFLVFGTYRLEKFSSPEHNAQINKFAMIQGNVSLEDKHDARYFSTNQERYYALSSAVSDGKTIVIWPETVVQEWIPANVGNIINSQNDIPLLPNGTPIIFGALSYEKKDEIDKAFIKDGEEREITRVINRYNSAIAVLTDGTIPYPYHKRILMPFGEYTPFSNWFPFLKELNSTAAEFNAGEQSEVFNIELLNSGTNNNANNGGVNNVKISPLICYEDIVPSLARESVLSGAEYLVSLSNDAWFGKTQAPYQHHIIALFRSIENRRFLLRSTNTGLTAVVSPTGQTLLSVPTDSEQTLIADAWPVKVKTLYSMTGEFPWYVLSFLLILGIATRKKYDL